MNVSLRLKLPVINNTTQEPRSLLVEATLLLNPLYALEEDILNPFDDIEEKEFPWIRKVLFNSSLTVYRLTKKLEEFKFIKEDDLILLRRDFTICLATNEIAKQMNKNNIASASRAKTLGDFSVATTNKNDPAFLLKIVSDSDACISEMKRLIEEITQSNILPSTFVKGALNPSTREYGRLWWLSDLPVKVYDGYASEKYLFNGNLYKAASFNNIRDQGEGGDVSDARIEP